MKYEHQDQDQETKEKYIKLPINTKTLLPLSTKSPKPTPPFCYELSKVKSIIVGWKRWKSTPILRKICSQGCNLRQQLI